MATVEQVVERAHQVGGLEVIAITDHEDTRGAHQARELAARRGWGLEVVVGAEVTTLQGHLLALFIESAPPAFRTVEWTIEAIHRQGGLAIAPHPMSWLTRSLGRRTLERLDRGSGPRLDGIETRNPSLAGRVTAAAARRANAGWRLAEVGGSDAHHLPHLGAGWTEFPGTTAAELRRAIEGRLTVAASRPYPPLREVGWGQVALGLAWGYCATPRKLLRRSQWLPSRRDA